MTIAIDARCAWVQVHPNPCGAAWRLTGFTYEAPEESGGNHNIYVHLLDADGMPAGGVRVTHGWPSYDHPDDKVTLLTDAEGNVNWAMWGNSTIDEAHPRGPYWICPMLPADMVDGMGLPANRHVNYRLTYRWVPEAGTPGSVSGEPPPPEGEGEPPGLWKAAYAATRQVRDESFPFEFNGEPHQVLYGAQMGILVRRDRDGALFLIYPDEARALQGGKP